MLQVQERDSQRVIGMDTMQHSVSSLHREWMQKLRTGATITNLGMDYGYSFERMRQMLHSAGIIRPRTITKRLSTEDLALFRQDYLSSSLRNRDIARKYGISLPSVKRLAKKFRLPKKYSEEYPKRKYRLKTAADLYQQGLSTFKIAEKLGIDDETVRGYLKKMGVSRRNVNGLSQEIVDRQDSIIRRMYLSGAKLSEIEKKAGIGSHGIEKRLRKMGIARNRHTPNKIGTKHDERIKDMFINGNEPQAIAREIGSATPNVYYRIKKGLFPGMSFKVKYCSPLTGRWRISSKTYHTLRQLRNGISIKRKFLGNDVRMIVIPVMPLVKVRKQHMEEYTQLAEAY